MRKFKVPLMFVLIFCMVFSSIPVFAENTSIVITNKANNAVINADKIDEEAASENVVILSPRFGFTTTKRTGATEITIQNNVVTDVNMTGNSPIPLDGYVVSILGTNTDFAVGDTVDVAGGTVPTATMAAYNQNGVRFVIDKKNVTRSAPMIVIYTDSFGEFTGTNQWGIEVVVDETGIITYKRGLGVGDQKGIEIPKRGYVLSGYNPGYREVVDKFNVGDQITLEGVSLVDLNKTVSFTYAVINPNAVNNPDGVDGSGVPYAGFRGTNQLIVYDKNYGQASTGTNSYGYEVIVEGSLNNGKIVQRGGNDNAIPANGYVLSGHGDAANFLIANAALHSSVKIDETAKTVTITTTKDTILAGMKESIEKAKKAYSDAENNLLDIDYALAKQALDKAVLAYNKAEQVSVDPTKDFDFLDLVDEITSQCNLVYYRTLESRAVEARGVWHRPKEKNLAEVKATLQELKDNNINIVFLETFYWGYTIYPSNVGLIKHHPNFKDNDYSEYGNDILKAFVSEAAKLDIEVHAWVEDFFVGEQSMTPQSPILEQKPEWALINYDGTNITRNEGGKYLFMDPAIPEVQQLLTDVYTEIVKNYDVKGLQLDYIRYPVSKYKDDTGYGDYSVKTFKQENGIAESDDIKDLMDKDKNPSTWETYWKKWTKWQENNVTNFVEKTVEELKKVNPEIFISTAIFASKTEAAETKRQNWPLWVENGWIDVTAPMAYYKDKDTVAQNVLNMVGYVSGMAFNYAGVAPSYMGLPAITNAEQTNAAQIGKAQGSALFASQFVLGLTDVQTVLQESTYRRAAVLPHAETDLVLQTAFDDILRKSDDIYIKALAMSSSQKTELNKEFDKILNMKAESSEELIKAADSIKAIYQNISSYADKKAKDRITEDLEYLEEIIRIKAKRVSLTEKAQPSPSPTVTPTSTPNPTISPSVTPGPTSSPTVTPNPTASPSVTPGPTSSPAVTPNPTVKPTASPNTTPAPTTKPTNSPNPVVTVKPTTKPTQGGNGAKTGDNLNISLWISISLLSVLTISIFGISESKRKKNNKK